jgi:peptidoglycan/LPS O-acetylase OafA/YrhL
MVVALHVWMWTGARQALPDGLKGFVGEFRLAVVFFFVLSGYLLARPWLRAALDHGRGLDLGAYAVRRAARILPAYWVAVVVAFALLHGSAFGVPAPLLGVFAILGQEQVPATSNALDPPTWSIVVEVGFYILLPLIGWGLVRCGRRWGRAGALGVCAALVVAGVGWGALGAGLGWPHTVTQTALRWLPVFACGIALAAWRPRVTARGSAALALAGAALVIGDGAWHWLDRGGFAIAAVGDLPGAFGFTALMAAILARPVRALDAAPLRFLGLISYGVYLWHMPIQLALSTRGALPSDAGVAFLVVLVPSVAMDTLSWYALERPVIAWAARRLAARVPSARRAPAARRVAVGASEASR